MKMTTKLNKFEKCRLLAARAGELVEGDTPKVDITDEPQLARNCNITAEKELDEGKIELEVYHKSK